MTILVGMKPIDMRCSIDRLTMKVVETFSASPQSKTLYLFHNKQRDKIKALLWDKNGFILLYKRIERDHFCFPKVFHEEKLLITHEQLYGLLAGFDFVRMHDYPELNFSYYF